MRKFAYLAVLTSSVLSTAWSGQQPHNFIIKFKSDKPGLVSSIQQSLQAIGVSGQQAKPLAGGSYQVSFQLKNGVKPVDEQEILQQLNRRSDVEYAVINRQGQFKPLPKLPKKSPVVVLSHDLQWDEFNPPQGIQLESAAGKLDGAWSYSLGDAYRSVVIAVLDTGIEQHPDLIENLFFDDQGNPYGWNFAGDNTNLADETGSYHGTHVAGTIAGYGQVMMGVGPKMKILPVKIPAANGMFYESNVINAIYWAAGADVPGVPKNQHKARVINMSFGVDEHPGKEISYCDKALQEAVDYARKNGVVVVAAAGNDNHWEDFNAPAICSGVVRVASTGPEGLRSYFSNYGPSVTFAAPGGDLSYGDAGGILSTVKPGTGYYGTGYDFYQGTSMASPHVVGLFGLLDSASPQPLSVKRLEQIVYATTHDFGISGSEYSSCRGKAPCGHGIVDALNAVEAVQKGYSEFFIPSEGIVSGDGHWKKVTDKHLLANFAQDKPLWQVKQGGIYAAVKGQYYQFMPAINQRCEVVGFDGIGCIG